MKKFLGPARKMWWRRKQVGLFEVRNPNRLKARSKEGTSLLLRKIMNYCKTNTIESESNSKSSMQSNGHLLHRLRQPDNLVLRERDVVLDRNRLSESWHRRGTIS